MDENIYKRCKERATELDMTVADLADTMGVSMATARRYDDSGNDRSIPNMDQFTAWCLATNTSPSWVLLGIGAITISKIPDVQDDALKWRMHVDSRHSISEDIEFLSMGIRTLIGSMGLVEKKEPEGS